MENQNEEEVSMLVHRLVATAFIPNPNNYLFVNHKDGDRSNSKSENLEWVVEGGDQFLYEGMNLEGLSPQGLTDLGYEFGEELED